MSTWYVKNDLPYLKEFPVLYDSFTEYPISMWHLKAGDKLPYKKAFAEPLEFTDYPYSIWLVNSTEDLPFKKAFPKMYDYFYETPEPVYQPPYICIYDMHNPQNAFEDNGLGVLTPTQAEITEELDGEYGLMLTHPIDTDGRWKDLLELNIIKACGQLFRIYSKETVLNSDGTKSRTVNARHISYDLGDKLLLDVRPENKNGKDFLDWIMSRIYNDDPEHYYTEYKFTWASDIERTATSYYIGTSVIGALIGEDNCFINRLGGEIHRDNFYFSINERKETSEENAFDIRYGVDMIDVQETIDYTEVITHLIAKDNFGHKWEVMYEETMRLHHPVTRSVIFDYEENNEAAFRQDAENYFRMYCQPLVNYTVNFADLKNNELYRDFINLQECNVGDTGNIYCEELGINTRQKVVKKTVDAITGRTLSIELGNLNYSLTRRDKYAGTIRINNSADKAAAAAKEEARKAIIRAIKTWGDATSYKYEEVEGTWQELYKEPIKEETE